MGLILNLEQRGKNNMKSFPRIIIALLIPYWIISCSKTVDVALPITSSNEKALELYKQGYNHFTQTEGLEAKNLFEQALSLDPDFILANLYVPETDPNKRKNYRDRAIANKNNGNEAEKLRVDIWVAGRDGRSTDVVSFAKELVNRYPNSSEAYVFLGNAYTAVKDFDSAIAQYNKALKINSEQYQAWWGLASHQVNVGGNLKLSKERQTKALALKYTKGMVKTRPIAPFSYQVRANVERQYSNFKAATPLYQKMVDVAEETGSSLKGGAHNVLAHNYLFSGDAEMARKNYDRSIALARSPISTVNRSFYKLFSYLFQNDYEGALSFAQELDNNLNTLEFTEASLNQQKARVEFSKFLAYAHNQQKEEAYSALNARKNYAAAAMVLMEVDEVRQRDFDLTSARNEAWYHILFGEYDQAEEQLAKLYSIASKIQNPTALDNYNALSGMVRLFSGDAKGALTYFNDNIIPENYLYYGYFKGLALKGAGETAKAEEIFNYIANYNFSGWPPALVRSLAIKQLES